MLEQTLGHITHADNLKKLVPADPRIRAEFLPITYAVDGWPARVPGYSNWTIRAGSRARRAVSRLARREEVAALFIHTQVPAILAKRWMRRIPTVVSIDATPLQYDQFGPQYGHERGNPAAERIKWRLNHSAFAAAAHMISWSHWSKLSLVEDYGVPADKVTVAAPGVDVEAWSRRAPRTGDGDGVKILFVGGDLQRKGGTLLIEAVRQLRQQMPQHDVELHMATSADLASEPGVIVHRGLRPNAPELIALYHQADIFCLPTLGDCLPMVLSEAGAAGLPLVATDVGAIGEIVVAGQTGFLVERGSVGSLVTTLTELVANRELRRRLGDGARALVVERFDARKNCSRLVEVLASIIDQSAPR